MDESFNHFAEIAAKLDIACTEMVDPVAQAVVANIQGFIVANGQIVTGDMLNSVAVEDGDTPLEKNVVIGVDYWIYPNYGTRYQPARPFVEPGIEQSGGVLEDEVSKIPGKLS